MNQKGVVVTVQIDSNIAFTLRNWDLADVPSLAKHANNFEIARYLRDLFPHPYSENDAREFIKMTQSSPHTHLAIEINNEAVGSVGIIPQSGEMRKNAEIGYWLSQEYWGKGVMTRVVPEVVRLAFETYEIDRVFACSYGNNLGSQRILQKSGFKLEAHLKKVIYKNGEYLDELIYGYRRK